jgi:hypothetical protein
MASKTEICNLAIGHLGTAKEINDLDTERSQEAQACRRFYSISLESTIRDVKPSFARKFINLSLVQQQPTAEWQFMYRYPNDVLYVKRILSGLRNDNRQTRIPYLIGQDSSGAVIYTDMESAVMEVITKVDNPTIYPPDFILMLSFRLAMYIAPVLTGGNAFTGITKELYEKYAYHLMLSNQNTFNEEQRDEEPQSEFIRAREGEVMLPWHRR